MTYMPGLDASLIDVRLLAERKGYASNLMRVRKSNRARYSTRI
jgi:hypothetical protein